MDQWLDERRTLLFSVDKPLPASVDRALKLTSEAAPRTSPSCAEVSRSRLCDLSSRLDRPAGTGAPMIIRAGYRPLIGALMVRVDGC